MAVGVGYSGEEPQNETPHDLTESGVFRSLRQSHFEGASVDITREQAADLLYKSQVERRLIQGGIFQSNDGATFGFLGRIERLDNRFPHD